MQVVRCLEKGLSFDQILKEVRGIFKKGNKVSITFKDTTIIDFIDCVVTEEGCGLQEDLRSIESSNVREGFLVQDYEILGIAGVRLVFDNIVEDIASCILEAKPFLKKGCEEGVVTMCFEGYDDGVLAIEEVCVG